MRKKKIYPATILHYVILALLAAVPIFGQPYAPGQNSEGPSSAAVTGGGGGGSGDIQSNGLIPFAADQSMGGFKLTDLLDGSAANDAVNKGQLDLKANDSAVTKKDGSVAFTGDQSMGSHKLTSVTDGSSSGDAVNRGQLDLKAPLASPTFSGTVTTAVTASRALVTGASNQIAASATTATELGYVNGVSSGIQGQLDLKAPLASPTFTGTIGSALTASRAVVTSGGSAFASATTTATEIGYVNGVTSAIQTQIDTKAADSAVIKKDGSVTYTAAQPFGGFNLTGTGNVTPTTTNTKDLGSSSLFYRDAYIKRKLYLPNATGSSYLSDPGSSGDLYFANDNATSSAIYFALGDVAGDPSGKARLGVHPYYTVFATPSGQVSNNIIFSPDGGGDIGRFRNGAGGAYFNRRPDQLFLKTGIRLGTAEGAEDNNATLEVVSTSKYVKTFPLMTETQRDALTGVEGACVWNTTSKKLNCHDGTVWNAAW